MSKKNEIAELMIKMNEQNEITEYMIGICESFDSAGFILEPVDSGETIMNRVLKGNREVIGFLVINDGFCCVGGENYSITFDAAKKRTANHGMVAIDLIKGGEYIGSLYL